VKGLAASLMTTFLSLTFIPVPAQLKGKTEMVSSSVAVIKPVESPQVKISRARLNEINAMDKSKLNSADKKELRKETRSIKKQLGEDSKFIKGMYAILGMTLLVFWTRSLVQYH
jgi:hypothetical protein